MPNQTETEVRSYLQDAREILSHVDISAVVRVHGAVTKARDERRMVFVFGNGGSASTATHFVCDLVKTASVEGQPRIRAMALTDNIPTMLAYANDHGYEDVFVGPLQNFLQRGDLVIALSGSGNSENVLRAVEYARRSGATTVALTGGSGGRLAELADDSIVVPSEDMQHIEDVHLLICHALTKRLMAPA